MPCGYRRRGLIKMSTLQLTDGMSISALGAQSKVSADESGECHHCGQWSVKNGVAPSCLLIISCLSGSIYHYYWSEFASTAKVRAPKTLEANVILWRVFIYSYLLILWVKTCHRTGWYIYSMIHQPSWPLETVAKYIFTSQNSELCFFLRRIYFRILLEVVVFNAKLKKKKKATEKSGANECKLQP